MPIVALKRQIENETIAPTFEHFPFSAEAQLGQMTKTRQKLDQKNREIDQSYLFNRAVSSM